MLHKSANIRTIRKYMMRAQFILLHLGGTILLKPMMALNDQTRCNVTKIGEAIAVWPDPKVSDLGQIIVILAKMENFRDTIYCFLRPSKSFLGDSFFSGV